MFRSALIVLAWFTACVAVYINVIKKNDKLVCNINYVYSNQLEFFVLLGKLPQYLCMYKVE